MHVDAESDPELFWGLRGGGGNFGIATRFEYHLHPVGPMVLGGPIFWPLDQAPAVLRTSASSRRPLPTSSASRSASCPPRRRRSSRPSGSAKPMCGLILAWAGDPAEGAKADPRRPCEAPLAARRSPTRRSDSVRRAPVDARRRRPARSALLLEGPPAARRSPTR